MNFTYLKGTVASDKLAYHETITKIRTEEACKTKNHITVVSASYPLIISSSRVTISREIPGTNDVTQC